MIRRSLSSILSCADAVSFGPRQNLIPEELEIGSCQRLRFL